MSLRELYDHNMQVSDFIFCINVNWNIVRTFYRLFYLNINSLRNIIIDVWEMIGRLQFDYFVISKIKLYCSFPSVQFNKGGYKLRNCRNRNKIGGGLIRFVKKPIIIKRLEDLETNLCEPLCHEIIISQKKWFCMSVCKPPPSSNNDTWNKTLNEFDNLIIMGDFNTDITK